MHDANRSSAPVRPVVNATNLVVLTLAAMGLSVPAMAQTGDDRFAPVTQFQLQQVNDRLERLERLTGSGGMAEISGSISTLERELRNLRGEVETLNNQLERASQRQSARLDRLEQRLVVLESDGTPPEAGLSGPGEQELAADTAAVADAAVDEDAASAGEDIGQTTDRSDAEPPSASPPQPVTLTGDDERIMYQRAFDAVMAGENEIAGQRFSEFLDAYPESPFAGDAWYWMGEAHYAQRDFVAAIEMFGNVVDRFPDSGRLADAKLKLGYAYFDNGETERAREVLEAVRDENEGSPIGRLAEDRLRRLERAE